jgi:heme-degrading monooxygenase HmoA
LVLEIAQLQVRPGETAAFEAAFRQAQGILADSTGYVSHQLQRCIEDEQRYALLVQWQTLEDHTQGFRGSPGYQEWRALLHHFYDPAPRVEHFRPVP